MSTFQSLVWQAGAWASAAAPAPGVDPWSGESHEPGLFGRAFAALLHQYASTSAQDFLFMFFAALAMASALATISRRNPVVAAVWLVGSFFCVAVCYVLMSATFLAALQVLVYAGAMMVLFVFVIMVLDVGPGGETLHKKPSRTGPLGYFGLFGVLILFVAWVCLGTLSRQVMVPGPDLTGVDFGTASAVGRELFDDYLFAFEAVSLLLLAAVVGAVVVARSRRERTKEAAAMGLTEDELRVAGLGGEEAAEGHAELSDAEARRPNPAMDFGAPSAGGHEGGN